MPAPASTGATTRGRVFTTHGYELQRDALAAAARALCDPVVTAVTGPIVFRCTDGAIAGRWYPTALTMASVFADPRGVPPVWIARPHDGADAGIVFADPLEAADAWIRCLDEASPGIVVLDAPIAERSMGSPTGWERLLGRDDYSALFTQFLERHRTIVEQQIGEIVILRETAFAGLRAAHADLVRRHHETARAIEALNNQRAPAAIEWGAFDRTSPVSRDWGYSRGGPVDRRYIRDFIESHSSDIRGRVLEVQEDDLTRAFGGPRVSACDVLDVNPANERATVIADLRHAKGVPADRYDCIVLTQTGHIIDDMTAVVRECHRLLAPGGVLLATFPCVSRVCLEYGGDGDFWRVTPAGARWLLSQAFDDVRLDTFGNVKTAVAFLHGLGEDELTDADYAVTDPYNPLLVGARACKRAADAACAGVRGIVLAYHRIETNASDRFDLNVPKPLFEAHVSWLREHATVIPLEDLLACSPNELPPDALALTFDDGYSEHLHDVAPWLASCGVPATFFITTAGLDSPHEYWWDLLERVTPPGQNIGELHDRFVHASFDTRETLVKELRLRNESRLSHPDGLAGRRPLLRDEVARLGAIPGMTIGAHGVHHLHLPDQPADVTRTEMRESREALEAASGRPVRLFAYPYGGVDRATAACARQEFHWALACHADRVSESFDAAGVPRLDVKAWSVDELASRIAALRRGASAAGPLRLAP